MQPFEVRLKIQMQLILALSARPVVERLSWMQTPVSESQASLKAAVVVEVCF
jgi:hypothetical protein